ncbi:MAG: hypothetical protein ABR936_16860 [Bacteroidota bacterium]
MSDLCDEILKHCYNEPNNVINPSHDLPTLFSTQKGVAQTRTRGALLHLEKIGYLEKMDHSGYVLTSEGELFVEGNGYAGQREREKSDRKLKIEVNESSIRTNNSVQQTNNFQKPIARITLLILVFAALVSVGNLVLNLIPKGDPPQIRLLIESLTQQGIQMQKKIDSLQTLIDTSAFLNHQPKVRR